jgi:predicted nucleic acid-binding protein
MLSAVKPVGDCCRPTWISPVMSFLIDSSVLLHCLKDPLTLPSGDEEFFLSIISADELLRAVAWAMEDHERTRRLAWVEAVLDLFPVLPIDRATSRMHVEIINGVEGRGLHIGWHEAWIAATCIAHGLILITLKPEAFQQIPGLQTRSLPAGDSGKP